MLELSSSLVDVPETKIAQADVATPSHATNSDTYLLYMLVVLRRASPHSATSSPHKSCCSTENRSGWPPIPRPRQHGMNSHGKIIPQKEKCSPVVGGVALDRTQQKNNEHAARSSVPSFSVRARLLLPFGSRPSPASHSGIWEQSTEVCMCSYMASLPS